MAIGLGSGCAEGTGDGSVDSGRPTDATHVDASDAAADGGADGGKDGAADADVDAKAADSDVPAVIAELFADTDYAGATGTVAVGATKLLGALEGRTSSVKVPTDYVLYGFSEVGNGGTISAPIVGDVTALGAADADAWRSVVLAPASEPFVTVYTAVGGGPLRYPLGSFPSLGAANDTIDGFSIPSGVTLVAYTDAYFERPAGVFVGPIATAQLPNRDSWSSFVVRATTPEDALVQSIAVYEDGSFAGRSLVLPPGATPDLDALPLAPAFRNRVSSVRSSSELAVWGFEYPSYGGAAYGPYTGDAASVSGNDDWDSVFVVPASLPTYTIYRDSNFGRAEVRPLVDVPNLQSRNDDIDGILVPAGYRVFGFTDLGYGGYPRRHDAGQSVTSHDDWTSIRIVRDDVPTITVYLNAGLGAPQSYPLGAYPDLVGLRNTIEGVDIPAGVHVCAFSYPGFQGVGWDLYGPFSTADLGASGLNDWDSMAITTGDTCP